MRVLLFAVVLALLPVGVRAEHGIAHPDPLELAEAMRDCLADAGIAAPIIAYDSDRDPNDVIWEATVVMPRGVVEIKQRETRSHTETAHAVWTMYYLTQGDSPDWEFGDIALACFDQVAPSP